VSQIRMPVEMKTVLLRFQLGIRTLLRIGLEAIYVTYWQRTLSTFCLCLETLWEAEFKGDRLTSLVKEMSRQPSIQAVAWVLLAIFSQVYLWAKIRAERSGKLGRVCPEKKPGQSWGHVKCVAVEEIRAIKKKPSTFHGTIGKMPWGHLRN
jgi:hypothetical protein